MKIDLNNKVCLVTGGSNGIGAEICKVLASCGAQVALHYNSSKHKAMELRREIGERTELFGCDLSETSKANLLIDRVVKYYGKVDVVVNNAGVAIGSDWNGNNTDKWLIDWDKTMNVNLKAVGLICMNAVEQFKAKKGGVIINIASRAAFRGDTPEYLAYAASKGGVVALTKSLARAYGKYGIMAFTIAPGFVKTSMAKDFIDRYGESLVLDDLSLNELTKPKDLAPTIAFLASGMANHATGTTIDINAGSYVH